MIFISAGSFPKRNLDKKLLELIVKDMQPFSIVEDSGFRAFVNALNPRYQIPCRQTVKKLMEAHFQEEKLSLLKELTVSIMCNCFYFYILRGEAVIKCEYRTHLLNCIFQAIPFVSLTTDMWTSVGTDSYLAVTCHYIFDDFRIICKLLDVYKYLKKKTFQALKKNITILHLNLTFSCHRLLD